MCVYIFVQNSKFINSSTFHSRVGVHEDQCLQPITDLSVCVYSLINGAHLNAWPSLKILYSSVVATSYRESATSCISRNLLPSEMTSRSACQDACHSQCSRSLIRAVSAAVRRSVLSIAPQISCAGWRSVLVYFSLSCRFNVMRVGRLSQHARFQARSKYVHIVSYCKLSGILACHGGTNGRASDLR